MFALLIKEILNPFYIFQIAAVIFWFWDGYLYYSTCIAVITIGTVVVSLYETIVNNKEIRRMARYSCQVKRMIAGRQTETADSVQLVPGDVVVVPEGMSLPCDMILLTGSAIVNEAMLTGESIPVMKSCIPFMSNEPYSEKESAKHTLYGGTHVI